MSPIRADNAPLLCKQLTSLFKRFELRDRMYRIPSNLDLSPVTGQFTTQVQVGQFDLQLTFGIVHFAIQSPVNLFRDGELFARWEGGQWPEPGFYEIINSNVRRCEVVNERLIAIEFENGIVMHLEDNWDEFESMQIYFNGDVDGWVV